MHLKPFRLLLLCAAALALAGTALIVVGLTPAFQTWAVRRVIAGHPSVRLQVGEVSAGWGRLEVKNLRYEQGGAVLTAPSVEIVLPLWSAGFERKVAATRFVARGWTLDLGQADGAAVVAPNGARLADRNPAEEAARTFPGFFSRLKLPCDLSLDGVEWAGDVILPESLGRVRVTVRGGGLRAGGEARFDFMVAAALRGAEVDAVTVSGRLFAGMDTPRTIARASVELDALARGAALGEAVVLHAEARAARELAGENCSFTLSRSGREILGLAGGFSDESGKLAGTWRIDVRDDDLARFVLLRKLPSFSLRGAGAAASDVRFADFAVRGKMDVAGEGLQVWRPEFSPLGRLNLAAEFDFSVVGPTIAVRRFEASIAGEQPVATLHALQPFEWRPAAAEFVAADPRRDVFGAELHGVPLAWLAPLTGPFELRGSHVRGEVTASPRNGGVTMRSVSALRIDGLSLGRLGRPWLERTDVMLKAACDYTPRGWQVEISEAKLRSGDTVLLSADGRAGQLAGADQPIKTTGKLIFPIPGWRAQPIAAGLLALTGGEVQIGVTASRGAATELETTATGKDLVAMRAGRAVKLPAFALTLRADIAADGRVAFNVPIKVEHEGRTTDLLASGTLALEQGGAGAIDAQISGGSVVLADATLFGAALLPKEGETAAKEMPLWAGWRGGIALQFKDVVATNALRLSEVSGKLRGEPGGVIIEGLDAVLGTGGRARAEGAVNFHAGAARPFAMRLDVDLRQFDPVPLIQAAGGGKRGLVEGKFDAACTVSAVGARLEDLLDATTGEIRITSRGGVFRGFPVTVNTPPESTSRLASIIASAGSVFGSRTAKKDVGEIASRSDAVAELARGWNPIPFDQLSLVLTRDATGLTVVKNFALIAPELRLTGSGSIPRPTGGRWFDEPLTMDYRLWARGRQAELLKYLGVLESHVDELGYAGCSMPLRVTGTLVTPDPAELDTKLAALALEKGGLVDRAAELFNRLRGAAK